MTWINSLIIFLPFQATILFKNQRNSMRIFRYSNRFLSYKTQDVSRREDQLGV